VATGDRTQRQAACQAAAPRRAAEASSTRGVSGWSVVSGRMDSAEVADTEAVDRRWPAQPGRADGADTQHVPPPGRYPVAQRRVTAAVRTAVALAFEPPDFGMGVETKADAESTLAGLEGEGL
jgi:hypothetical protein